MKRTFVLLVRQLRDTRERLLCLEWLKSKRNRWDDLGLAPWEVNAHDHIHKQRIWRRLICLVFSVATKPHQGGVFPHTLWSAGLWHLDWSIPLLFLEGFQRLESIPCEAHSKKPLLLENWWDQTTVTYAVCLYWSNPWHFLCVSRMFLHRERTRCPEKKCLHKNTVSHTKTFFPHHRTCKSNVVRCHIQVVHTVKQAPLFSISCLQNHPWPADAQTEIEYYFTIKKIYF